VTGWVDVPDDHPFGLHTLPYGAFDGGVCVAVGDRVLDLTAASRALLPAHAALFEEPSLDAFLAAGRERWSQVRAALSTWCTDLAFRDVVEPLLRPAVDVTLRLPFTIADYVDFYASEHHATNVGRLFRPDQPLTPNWRHLPIGYHGRAGTVVVSGTPVVRPSGQRREADGSVVFGPTTRLDLEAEVGFVVGTGSRLGRPVPLAAFEAHVFGACLVNDWSARDIQAWEYVPLGPFLGKSFATSVSPWVVPLEALDGARVAPPPRDPTPLAYLDDTGAPPWGLDITLEVRVNGELLSRPPFAAMYWTPAQMLAHLTVNGASLRTGDLFASGTVSGPRRDQWGSLIELGEGRRYLDDGDEVAISAVAAGGVGFGEVRGRVVHG
jgi:fumarylacetoacetase